MMRTGYGDTPPLPTPNHLLFGRKYHPKRQKKTNQLSRFMIIPKGYVQMKAAEPETNKKVNTMQNITPQWYTDISKGPKGKRYFEFQ